MAAQGTPKVESQQHIDADEDTTGRMGSTSTSGLPKGSERANHPPRNGKSLVRRDWRRITEFLNKYLSAWKSIAAKAS
jgi:hypothetical protein